MKEVSVAPRNQHIVYLCYLFWYHINPPSNRCSSRDFLCCLLSRYFLNGCRFDFLSLSPDLTSCPDRSPLFFLFQVVVTRGGMRRSASPRDAPHRIRSFLPLRLGFSSTWPTATRGDGQTDSPAQCAVVIGFMGPCGDRRQQFLAAEGTVVPSRRGDRRHCWPSLMPWPMPPLPPRAAGRASVPPHTRPPTHAAHLTTHQPPLDQNS